MTERGRPRPRSWTYASFRAADVAVRAPSPRTWRCTWRDREDIEALSHALYKIPKTVEKFAERFNTLSAQPDQIHFGPLSELVEKAAATVVAMVKHLRRMPPLEVVKALNDRLQYLEGEGDRIIKTLGHKMVRLQPVHGFAAETAAAMIIQVASRWGMPLSTTHVISSAIMGVGAAKRFTAVKWFIVERMVWAWILTIPVTATLGYTFVRLCRAVGWLP